MSATAAIASVRDHGDAAIAGFARGFSLEAAAGSDIAALAGTVAPGTRIYLRAAANRAPRDMVADAIRLRAAGFEPVPHIAVRMFATVAALEDCLARLAGEALVRRILVIAGDGEQPAGEFRSSIAVIDGGLVQRHGITEIGIAGYPEGHPRLSRQDLDRALIGKIAGAESMGLKVHIVTQFCFDAASILSFIGRLRDFGLEQPVRVGLAGPTNVATLLHYARRCGVRASAQGLARQSGLVRQWFAMSTPGTMVQALANGRLGAVKPHFFSFGGLACTARWAAAVAARRITIEGACGFRVEPAA